MSEYARAVRQHEARQHRTPHQDAELRFAQNLSQGVGADLGSGLNAALSGDLGALDLVQLGLKSRTLRLVGEFLTTVNTRDVESPPGTGQSIVQDIRDLKETGQAIQDVMSQMLKLIDEISQIRLPEIGLDPLEMALHGIPGVTLSELEKVRGCR